MMNHEEITPWLARLAAGDEQAVEVIWNRYFERLVRLARRKLENVPGKAADEEDLAISAMESFCRGAVAGRFPRLDNRQNLWRLLLTITARKARRAWQRQFSSKEGGARLIDEAAVKTLRDGMLDGGMLDVPDREHPPDITCEMADTCRRLLEQLPSEDMRKIAIARLEGYTNQEIAGQLDCSVRRIERKLGLIRDLWEREA